MNELCGPGGCASGLCQKHKVPLIHTITEQTYCAVCLAAQVHVLAEALLIVGMEATARGYVQDDGAPEDMQADGRKVLEAYKIAREVMGK